MEDGKIRQRFSFSFVKLEIVLKNPTPEKKNANLWQTRSVGIRAMKFETARILFLGDVFYAAAVVVA